MATSNSYDWTLTRDSLITLAFQRTGVLEDGESPSTAQVTMAATLLEALFKALENDGIGGFTFPWTNQSISASSSVTGDSDGAAYRCIYPHTSGSTTRPTSGAQWPVYWIADQSSSLATWLTSTSYTASGVFSLPTGSIGVNAAYLLNLGVSSPLTVLSAKKYSYVQDKGAKGVPEYLYVDREQSVCILWPQPDQVSPTYVLRYQNVQLLEDFDSGSNNADLPTRGLHMLSYGLAEDLSYPLGLPLQERIILANKFEQAKKLFKAGADKDFRGNERSVPSTMIV